MVDEGFEITEDLGDDEPIYESVRAFRDIVVHVNEGFDIADLLSVQTGKAMSVSLIDDLTLETDTAGIFDFTAIVTEDQGTEDLPRPRLDLSIAMGDRIDTHS